MGGPWVTNFLNQLSQVLKFLQESCITLVIKKRAIRFFLSWGKKVCRADRSRQAFQTVRNLEANRLLHVDSEADHKEIN